MQRNFAVWFPVYDVMFGTAHVPKPGEYPPSGVEGVAVSKLPWLGLAASGKLLSKVTLAGNELCDALAAVLDSEPDSAKALSQALELLGRDLLASDFRSGCPVATVALDAASDSEPIRAACEDVYARWQRLIAARTGDEDVATVVLAAIEGALLLARTRRSLDPLHAVGARLSAFLGRPRP